MFCCLSRIVLLTEYLDAYYLRERHMSHLLQRVCM